MKRKLLLLLVLVLSLQAFSQEQLTYRETTGNKVETYMQKIEKTGTGYIVHERSHTIWLDHNYATYKWEYRDSVNGVNIVANRNGNKIYLKGSVKGKKVDKVFNINQQPWYQSWSFCLKGFLSSNNNNVKFWTIKPDELEVSEFEATKQGKDRVMVNGRKLVTLHIKVNLTGLLAAFWCADFWFRISDFRYLRYESVQGGPGTPLTVIELINEN